MRLSGAKQISGKGKAGQLLNSISSLSRGSVDAAAATAMWTSLRGAIDKIFMHHSSSLSFEELYGYGYKLCIHKHGDMLYGGMVDTIREHLETNVKAVASTPNEHLLQVLKKSWDDYKVVIGNVKDILMYMDRTYVKTYKKSPVYDMALTLFREIVVYNANVRERLKSIILENVDLERSGQLIDRDLMRSTTYMLVELGGSGNVGTDTPYESEFEREFLDMTTRFYAVESQDFIGQYTCPDYVKKADARLTEEEDRARSYLAPSSLTKLLDRVEEELIVKRAAALVNMDDSGCAHMFAELQGGGGAGGASSRSSSSSSNSSSSSTTPLSIGARSGGDREADLTRMFSLFSRKPATLDLIRASMFTFLKSAGIKILAECSTDNSTRSPVRFVQMLLDLKSRFDHIVSTCFCNDKKTLKKVRFSLSLSVLY